MFCEKCGAQVQDGTKFCSRCGAPIGGASAPKIHNSYGNSNSGYENYNNGYGSDYNGNSMGTAPASRRIQTDRALWKYIVFNILTCGIYGYIFIYDMAQDANIICDGDGESTSGLAMFIILSFITCGLYAWYWYYTLGNRLAQNAPRYGLSFQENGSTILMWCIVGVFVCGIGPYIAVHILIKNMNALAMRYNQANGF